MMGTKTRQFTPVPAVSLEELVPADHFYRHLDRVLDLSFVRELVRDCYVASVGRPSIDPMVFFKLQLVMFFEDIRSERLLLRLVADRLSVRWYLGYNLDEPLPDHSSLTRIRTRYGLAVFRRFLEAIAAWRQGKQRPMSCHSHSSPVTSSASVPMPQASLARRSPNSDESTRVSIRARR